MSEAMPTKTKASDVAALRTKLGLTQQEFASVLGLSTVSVSRWEHGHTVPTDGSNALLGLIRRALAKHDAGKLTGKLRAIGAQNETERVVALVHLGD